MSKPLFLRRGALGHLKAAAGHLWLVVRHLGLAAIGVVSHVLAAILAIVVVFEEWGWRPLAAALGTLARLRPFAWLEQQVRALPPYAALAVFGLPSLLLLPLKLLSLYLLGHGYKLAAVALFVSAKVVGTALVARIYILTEAALKQIGWFKRAFDRLMPIKTALQQWVRESTVWRYGRAIKLRLKDRLRPYVHRVRGGIAAIRGRLLRR